MDKLANYVEDHPIEIPVDYRDELSEEQVNQILEGKSSDVKWEIEEDAYGWEWDHNQYWADAAIELGIDREEIDKWLEEGGFYPSFWLTDAGWNTLLGNTRAYITATVWDADWNFNDWAYGGPLTYSDVKESLKILGINPLEFKKEGEARGSGSLTSGPGRFRGYFPNMPDREPKVNMKDLWSNLTTLYDGIMSFCLGDLEDIIDVLEDDSRYLTFKKGTNVVMYNHALGAGITDVELTDDVVIPRKKVEFNNDGASRYGIQACYGFTHDFWSAGKVVSGKGVQNGK